MKFIAFLAISGSLLAQTVTGLPNSGSGGGGGGGGGGTPGAPSFSLQYNNNAGGFGGTLPWLWTPSTQALTGIPTGNLANGQPGAQNTWIQTGNGWTWTSIEGSVQNPNSGNLQSAYSSIVYLSGSYNPTDYGNLNGYQETCWAFNGRNSADNNDKKTIGCHNYNAIFPAAGQKNGLGYGLTCTGVGDCIGVNVNVTCSGQITAQGDEGCFPIQGNGWEPQYIAFGTLTSVTRAGCAATSLTANVSKSSGPLNPSVIPVNSTTGCAIGQWITIDNGALVSSGDIHVDTTQITLVNSGSCGGVSLTSGQLCGYIQQTGGHLSGAPVAPAVVLGMSPTDLNPTTNPDFWGIGRFVVDDTTAQVSGTVTSLSPNGFGSTTLTDSGASFSNGMVGGNANLPGCVYFTADDYVAGNGTEHFYYPILTVVSGTAVALYKPYFGSAVATSAYHIARCGRIAALQMDYSAGTSESVSAIVLESNAFTWNVSDRVTQYFPPWASVGGQKNIIQFSFPNTQGAGALYGGANLGQAIIDAVFEGGGPGNNTSTYTANHMFRGDGNTIQGAFTIQGIDKSGILLNASTFNGGGAVDPKMIQWGGALTGGIGPNPASGNMWIGSVNSNAFEFGSVNNGGTFPTNPFVWFSLDGSHVSYPTNGHYIMPNANGTIALQNPGTLAGVALPDTATNTIDLGTVTNSGQNLTGDITIQLCCNDNGIKSWHFTEQYFSGDMTANTWYIMPPSQSTVGFANTALYDLDVEYDGGIGSLRFRLRRTGGAATGITAYPALNFFSPFAAPTWTTSNATATGVATPTQYLSPLTVTQANHQVNILGSTTAFASLGSPSTPNFVWCSDCNVTNGTNNACVGSSTGAYAFRVGSTWVCSLTH